jgi:hypothetical protein
VLGEYNLNLHVITSCRYQGSREVIAVSNQLYNELILVEPIKQYEVIEEARLELSERPETVLFCGLTDRLFVGERSQIEIVDLIAA